MNAPDRRAIALVVACAWALLGASPLPGIRADDYQQLVGLDSPAIARDGKHAALIVRHILWNDDRRSEELALVDLTTGSVATLAADRTGLSDPKFSPDSSHLAFLARDGTGKDAHVQILVTPLDGGDARSITHAGDGIDAFAWRPDGRAIAYAASDPNPVRTGADRFRDSFIFTTEPIVARESPRPSHLFTSRSTTARRRSLRSARRAPPTRSRGRPTARRSDSRWFHNAILNDQNYSRAALLDVASKRSPADGTRRVGNRRRSSRPTAPASPTSTLGRSAGQLDAGLHNHACRRRGTPLSTALERPIADQVWSHDSKSLVVTAPDGLTNALYRLRSTERSSG